MARSWLLASLMGVRSAWVLDSILGLGRVAYLFGGSISSSISGCEDSVTVGSRLEDSVTRAKGLAEQQAPSSQ